MTAGIAGLAPGLAQVLDCGWFVDCGCSLTRSLAVEGWVASSVYAAAATGVRNNWPSYRDLRWIWRRAFMSAWEGCGTGLECGVLYHKGFTGRCVMRIKNKHLEIGCFRGQ